MCFYTSTSAVSDIVRVTTPHVKVTHAKCASVHCTGKIGRYLGICNTLKCSIEHLSSITSPFIKHYCDWQKLSQQEYCKNVRMSVLVSVLNFLSHCNNSQCNWQEVFIFVILAFLTNCVE